MSSWMIYSQALQYILHLTGCITLVFISAIISNNVTKATMKNFGRLEMFHMLQVKSARSDWNTVLLLVICIFTESADSQYVSRLEAFSGSNNLASLGSQVYFRAHWLPASGWAFVFPDLMHLKACFLNKAFMIIQCNLCWLLRMGAITVTS